MALTAFTAFSELGHVIRVDDDADLFDTNNVLGAMRTRFQGDVSTVFIPGVNCHPLDPSSTPAFSPMLSAAGTSCKTIFDCTGPIRLKERFQRSQFADVDLGDVLTGRAARLRASLGGADRPGQPPARAADQSVGT